ncbi:hypothetical protein BCR35DRAFT_350864 [Leucosporidium creatinivorum]|uniref:Uncharacterized protein n=1 Tax=Leucosporidium creatinivorum TaxID=106004 RepID=A0A1Y2FX52_9BASI|nr:hypothetical protein BCR35DRAFT_350864 [Leucosporidium creatinivorum]
MASEPTPPSLTVFHPSPNEKEAAQHLFEKADTDQLGVLTGDKAVPFFQHSSLPPALLGEIWQLSDPENSGFLTPERFAVAFRLIGHAQSHGGQGDVKSDWIGTPGPFPRFQGFAIPEHLGAGAAPTASASASPAPAAQSAPLQAQGTGSAAGVSITTEEKARYAKLFANSGPVAGLLDGDKARDIFIKSKLPFETLGQIWNLADTHSRGSLDVADFTIGMHLIQHTMNGALPQLPAVLNPALYASATSLPLPAVGPAGSRIATSAAPAPASPLRQSSIVPPAPVYASPQQQFAPQAQQQPWDISAQEKLESDGYFDGIDTTRKGTIEGEAAVGFFMQSGLGMEVLARVWDLADIRQTGALNKDEFAVALKLIRDKVAGKEVPQTLGASLIPPSLRQGSLQSQPSGPQRDLLDLMDDDPAPSSAPAFSAPPPQPSIFPQATGSSIQRTLSPQTTGTRALSPQSTGSRALSPQATGSGSGIATPQYGLQGTIFPQATGASQQTLSPQTTGFANNFSAPPAAAPVPQPGPAASANFFDDNDDADTRAKLSADSVQLGNLQDEHKQVTSAVTDLATTRAELETQLSETTKQINELQVSLSQARAAHETERTMVDELRKKNEDQKAVLARARTELITAESDLSGLRVERTEIEGNFLRDKEEVREMKRKMAEVGAETTTLKTMLEKLKKEARQQKGLGAISRKQLATAETEREKTETDLRSVEREVAEAGSSGSTFVKEEESDSPFDFSHSAATTHPAVAAAAALPLPTSPGIASPASSVRSTNPFDRMGSLSQQISPQPTGNDTSVAGTSLGLPAAAAVAVGAGAVAAASAVGAGVASLWKGDEEEEQKPQIKEEDQTAFPSTSTETKEPETDPFGLPVSSTTSNSNAAFDSAFDQGFGDDFSTSVAPASASSLAPTAEHNAAFDDAFGAASSSTAVPAVEEPISESQDGPRSSSTLTESSEAPVHNATPLQIDEPVFNAPLLAANDTSTEEDSATDSNVFASPAVQSTEEQDSSDDEEEVEEAGPSSRYASASARSIHDDEPEQEAEQAPATSTSDSGESFVHVHSQSAASSSVLNEEDSAVATKFPALEAVEEPEVTPAPVAVDAPTPVEHQPEEPITAVPADLSSAEEHAPSPTSELDTFEDANTNAGGSSAEPASPTTGGPTDSLASPTTSLATVSDAPTATTTLPTHRRAPPPPPASRSSVPTPAPVTSTSTAFDDAFGDSSSPSTSAAAPAPASATDDFDSAFADLGPSAPVVPAQSDLGASTSSAVPNADFDDAFDFDDSFKADFDEPPTVVSGPTSPSASAFDESFANFDSSFAPAASVSGTEEGARRQDSTGGFSFDDSFGASGEPTAVGAPVAEAAKEDDSVDVKQLVGMGFSRVQSIQALEKADYNVSKAINSLLG